MEHMFLPTSIQRGRDLLGGCSIGEISLLALVDCIIGHNLLPFSNKYQIAMERIIQITHKDCFFAPVVPLSILQIECFPFHDGPLVMANRRKISKGG